jgi:hypothetical protein
VFPVKLKIPFGPLKDKPADECNEGELAEAGYDDESFVAYPELQASLAGKLKPRPKQVDPEAEPFLTPDADDEESLASDEADDTVAGTEADDEPARPGRSKKGKKSSTKS